MVIKINYTSSDIYVSTNVSPVYVVVNYSGVNSNDGVFVPYTGATTNVNLGAFTLTAASLIKSGGTSSQFLKADGSVDSTTYTPSTRNITINGTTQDLSADRTFTVSSANIYTADGTLTGNRTVTLGGFSLDFKQGVNSGLKIDTNADVLINKDLGTAKVYRGLSVSPNGNTGFGASTNNMFVGDGTNFAFIAYNYLAGARAVFGGITGAGNQLNIALYGRDLEIYNAGTIGFKMFDATSNIVLQRGGTFTDAGFRLDVNGTARVNGKLTLSTPDVTNNYLSIGNGVGIADIFHTAYRLRVGGVVVVVEKIVGDTSGTALDVRANSVIDAKGYLLANTFGVGTDTTAISASSIVEFSSTTKGFLPPRMTTIQRDAIVSPATGLVIYNTTTLAANVYNGTNWAGLGGDNIYTTDGTLSSNRLVTLGGRTLTFRETTASLNSALVLQNDGTESLNLINAGSTYGITTWRNQSVLASSKSLLFVTDTNSVSGGSSTFKFIPGGYNVVEQVTIGNNFTTFSTVSANYDLTINTGSTTGLSQILFKSSTSVTNGFVLSTAPSFSFGTLIGKETALGSYGVVSLRSNDTGYIRFMTGNADPASSTEKARITAAGRLLLGTTTESTYLLDVNGTARVSGNATFEATLSLISTGSQGLLTISNTYSTLRLQASSSVGQFNIQKGFGYSILDSDNEQIRYNAPTHLFGGTTNVTSALVNIESTTKGFLPPRMTTTQINAIATPAEGLIAYNTTISHLCCYQAGAWVKFSHSPM